LPDIFHVTRNDLLLLPLFKDKKTDKLIEAINAVKKISLERFLFALGIRHVGEETAIALADLFKEEQMTRFTHDEEHKGISTITDLLLVTQELNMEKLDNVEGFGEKLSKEIFEWFKAEKNQQLLKKLEEAGVHFEEEEKPFSLKLKGMTFVVTGTLKDLSRDQAKERIRQNGGKIANAVTSKTTYLVQGESEKASTKEKAAQKHGVKIIVEGEFLKMIEL